MSQNPVTGDPGPLPDLVTVVGSEPGPTLTVLAGVHGDELEGVLAARRIARTLDRGALRGTVRFAAPAHPAAWDAVTRESPLDGLNLARVFPGSPEGRPTERVAAFLTAEAIAGSDLLIDLHSAGESFDMPLLAGFHDGGDEVATRAYAAARAFGAPYLWRHPELSVGRSLSAAEALGIPSIYVEGRGGGQVRWHDLSCYIDGVARVMKSLGMIDAAPEGYRSVVVTGDGNTDEGIPAPTTGYFVTAVHVGDDVERNALIGEILDEEGQSTSRVLAPTAGVVMLLRRRARVRVGEITAIVAPREAADDAERVER